MKILKIVYEDAGRTKVLRCQILKEDEFTYTVLAEKTKDELIIGKRAIVKIQAVDR